MPSTVQQTLNLAYTYPLPWSVLLAYLHTRAIPGVEQVTENTYARTIRLNNTSAWFSLHAQHDKSRLQLQLHTQRKPDCEAIAKQINKLVDLDADIDAINTVLKQDPQLAPLVNTLPGLRLPGAWDGFEFTVRAILGQQVSVKGASTLAGRLASTYGDTIIQGADGLSILFPKPQVLADAAMENIGLTQARIKAIKHLARAVCEGEVSFAQSEDPEVLAEKLMALPGIGRWTADYVLLRICKQPDVFPSGDLGLLRAAQKLGIAQTEKQLLQRAQHWRPWRAYAALYLWQNNAIIKQE